jgi:hypothetical protein
MIQIYCVEVAARALEIDKKLRFIVGLGDF